MDHPNSPSPAPDPHSVLVVFRWNELDLKKGRAKLVVGVRPLRSNQTWYAPKKSCRLISIATSEERKKLPESLLSVVNYAMQQPHYNALRWFAMLTPDEAQMLLLLGDGYET